MSPNKWVVTPLSRLAVVQTGLAKNLQKALTDPVELPYIRVANVQDGFLDLSEIKTVRIERGLISRYSLQHGDVLFTEGGDNDKLGRGTIWQSEIPNCLHENHVFVVRTDRAQLLPQFLSALAASRYGKAYFLKCSKQSTNLASINSNQLKEFPVLLPPIEEQQAIIAVLTSWDRAIDLTTQLIAAKQQRKRGLMQQLLTGQRRFAEFAGEEWRTDDLGNLVEINPSVAKLGSDELISFIRMEDVSESAKIIRQSPKRYKEVAKSGYTSFQDEDVIIAKITPCFENGKGALARNLINGVAFGSTEFHVLRPKYELDNEFLHYLTTSHTFRKQGASNMRGSAGQKRVPKDFIEAFTVRLPPLAEQRRIAAVLQACDQEIALLEQKRELLQQQKRGLMQQLLTGRVRVDVDPVAV